MNLLQGPASQLYLYYYKDSPPVSPSTGIQCLRQDCQGIGGCFIVSVPIRPLNPRGYWPAAENSWPVFITEYTPPVFSGGSKYQVLISTGTYDTGHIKWLARETPSNTDFSKRPHFKQAQEVFLTSYAYYNKNGGEVQQLFQSTQSLAVFLFV